MDIAGQRPDPHERLSGVLVRCRGACSRVRCGLATRSARVHDEYAIFIGNVPLTYPQYLDAQTQRTLVAQPGHEYDVELASGYSGPPAPIPGTTAAG